MILNISSMHRYEMKYWTAKVSNRNQFMENNVCFQGTKVLFKQNPSKCNWKEIKIYCTGLKDSTFNAFMRGSKSSANFENR